MNLTRKGRNTHRGIIGVESAIVMIAFVLVAAALAFVVLNMGFSTTQKAKSAVTTSIAEASSTLEIAGKVSGAGDGTTSVLEVLAVPLKVASGGESVNVGINLTSIAYFSDDVQYDDIYKCHLESTTYASLSTAIDAAVLVAGCDISSNPITGADPANTSAFIYWTVNRNDNFIVDLGEHAVMAIVFNAADQPESIDTIAAEILVPTGSPLTVERQVPNIFTTVVDLG